MNSENTSDNTQAKVLNKIDVSSSFSFTYDDLFKAFVAGDTESMRTGNDVDREEFEEWFNSFFKKN